MPGLSKGQGDTFHSTYTEKESSKQNDTSFWNLYKQDVELQWNVILFFVLFSFKWR